MITYEALQDLLALTSRGIRDTSATGRPTRNV
jgi:hypothetical protein